MKIPTDNPLDFAVWLYKNLEDSEKIQSRQFAGTLPDGIDFPTIESALEQFDMAADGCSEDNRRIHFEAPHRGEFFAWSLSDLLQNPIRSLKAPSRFYLADIDYLHPDQEDTTPDNVKAYFQHIKLIGALQPPFSDYEHKATGEQTLVFITDRKLEICANINAKELAVIDHADELIDEFIHPSIHQEQKRTILKSCLTELFSEANSRSHKISINDLATRIDVLLERARNSYDLFISEFSFNKIRNEVEREKLDFTIKLNGVFSSIQNQLLAIPVALVLVGGQMENTSSWTQKNVVIWLGALVFSLLLSLLVRNQKSTVAAIRQEIDQQWTKITQDHRSVAHRFEDMYRSLEQRYRDQVLLIWTVDLLVAIALATATVFLLWTSVPWDLAQHAMLLSPLGIIVYLVGLAVWHWKQCFQLARRLYHALSD